MTIRLIHAPRSSSSYWHIESNVKEVTQTRIVYHGGGYFEKRLCTKVELLSVMDAPEDESERFSFFSELGCTKYNNIRECEVECTSGYYKMTNAQFSALDLPKHL